MEKERSTAKVSAIADVAPRDYARGVEAAAAVNLYACRNAHPLQSLEALLHHERFMVGAHLRRDSVRARVR